MQNRRFVAFGAAVLACLLVVFGIVWYTNRPATTAGSKIVTVEVIHKDKSQRTFLCETEEEYLAEVLVAEGIVEDNPQEFGLYILVADGEEAVYEDDGGYWNLLVNGEPAAQGASGTPVTDGDNYTLEYTIYSDSE